MLRKKWQKSTHANVAENKHEMANQPDRYPFSNFPKDNLFIDPMNEWINWPNKILKYVRRRLPKALIVSRLKRIVRFGGECMKKQGTRVYVRTYAIHRWKIIMNNLHRSIRRFHQFVLTYRIIFQSSQVTQSIDRNISTSELSKY